MDDLGVLCFAASAVIALVVAAHAALTLSRNFLSVIIFGGYGVVFGLAPTVLFWQGGDGVGEAGITSFLGLVGLIGGRTAGRHVFGPASDLNAWLFERRVSVKIAIASFGVGVAGLLGFAYGSAGSLSGYIASGRFEFRLEPAIPFLAVPSLYLIPFIGVPSMIMVFSRQPLVSRAGLALGLGTGIFIFYFLKGTRSIPVGLVAGVFFLFLAGRVTVRGPEEASRSSRSKPLIMVEAMLVALLSILILPNMYEARKYLSEGNVSVSSLFTGSQGQSSTLHDRFEREPLNYSEFLLSATRIFPENEGFLWTYPIRRLLFFPLKSGGLKPPDTNRVFASALGKGTNETTIPPSLPGEGYVVLGGVLGAAPWLAIYGLGLALVEARACRRSVTLGILAVGFPSALLMLRGQLYEVTMTALVTLVISVLLIRVCDRKPTIKASNNSTTAGLV